MQKWLQRKWLGELWIDNEFKEISEGMLVYIPRCAKHRIRCKGEIDLKYIYIACWPECKVPPSQTPKELKVYERKLLPDDKD